MKKRSKLTEVRNDHRQALQRGVEKSINAAKLQEQWKPRTRPSKTPVLRESEDDVFIFVGIECPRTLEACRCDHCKKLYESKSKRKTGKKTVKRRLFRIRRNNDTEFIVCNGACKLYTGMTGTRSFRLAESEKRRHERQVNNARRKREKVLLQREKNRGFITRKTSFVDLCGIDQAHFKEKSGGKIAKSIALWLICCWRLKLVKVTNKFSLPEKYRRMEAKLLRWCEKNNVPNRGAAAFG